MMDYSNEIPRTTIIIVLDDDFQEMHCDFHEDGRKVLRILG